MWKPRNQKMHISGSWKVSRFGGTGVQELELSLEAGMLCRLRMEGVAADRYRGQLAPGSLGQSQAVVLHPGRLGHLLSRDQLRLLTQHTRQSQGGGAGTQNWECEQKITYDE